MPKENPVLGYNPGTGIRARWRNSDRGGLERFTLFRLARDLGMTVAELEQRLSSAEFVEWQAFYQVEYEIQTDTLPPLEIDDPGAHSAAIDLLF